MAVASISSNYTLRKKDISILQYPDASQVGGQTVYPVFGKNGRFCTGVQKLVQRYTIILLTNLTSQPNFPEFGTSLLYTLKGGISPVDQLRAAQIFDLASYDVITTMKVYQSQNSDIPADEKIVRATLTNLSLLGSTVAFEVTIITEAGDNLEFIIPLPK
jgi:hypothetical protein